MATKDVIEAIKGRLFARQQAYQQVLNPESEFVKTLTTDLAGFCRADKSTFHQDARIHAVLEGRREVWLRIQSHLKLSPEELWKTYGKDIE